MKEQHYSWERDVVGYSVWWKQDSKKTPKTLRAIGHCQWITAKTERKKKKVHISGTENELYVSEMEAGKHLLLILTFTLSSPPA